MTTVGAAADTVRTWGEMVKFSHSAFALPFALFAAFLAGWPELRAGQVGLVLLCMVAARSAAMTFNRIVDAPFDARNPRTAGRALPRGLISARAAWAFFAASAAAFLAGCAGFWVYFGNAWPLRLGATVLAFLCYYSYTKRFTRWSHFVLGAGIAFAPVAAWIAINPATLGPAAWLLMAAVTCWIAGFDLIYACQDAAFDRSAGLHSVPARMGLAAALGLARGLHALTVAALVGVGVVSGAGALYYAGVVAVAALLAVENAIVSPRDLSRVNLAFFTINGVVGLAFGGLGILDVVLS